MRTGRQSLTQHFIHFFVRRDYTPEELALDRSLRKQAGDLNAQAGKLLYVVRDFEIFKLKAPCDLPRRTMTTAATGKSNVMPSARRSPVPRSVHPTSSKTTHAGVSQDGVLDGAGPLSPHPVHIPNGSPYIA
ncbi:hypothetical protein Y032_0117g691 [Ancylostoma ceylanicum]|uniref:Uncharacterized protein n=1 Tax=Ancylostoma ceylanicum TaxID=53326 RepID=A0A016TC83_9BILA|nr:hypothetical protein Y032_0117g691 [Ancylostoma ceylanicum]